MMRLVVLWALTTVACGEQERPQSKPIADGRPDVPTISAMTVDANEPAPVGVEALSSRLFSVQELQLDQQRAVVGALNLVPAPCAVCDGKTMAECLVDVGIAQCLVLDKLTKRAVRMAKNGVSTDYIKVEINYPDLWLPRLGTGKPVTIHLYRANKGPFADDVNHIHTRLVEIFGADVQIFLHEDLDEEAARLGVRSRPTWFVNGHRFRGVQSVDGLARFVSYELADEP